MEEKPPPLAPEALLEQQEWVRRVARALVADEHRAEDLAQQVWVKALEAPPRVRVSLRAWLGTVLRNAASDLRRGGARRRAREEAAARDESLPSPADVVARAETLHRVSAAAIALREPYRTVILLRYFEDLSPPDIARRLDVTLETVRTRLRRGLEILREDLDAGPGDRRAWMAALLPLAGPVPVPPGAFSGGDAAARAAQAAAKEIAAMTARSAAATVLALLVSAGAALWLLLEMEPAETPAPATEVAGGRRGGAKAPAPTPAELGTISYVRGGGGNPTPPDLRGGGTPTPPDAAGLPAPPYPPHPFAQAAAAKDGRVLDEFGMPVEAADAGGKPRLVVRGVVVDAETGAALASVQVQAFSPAGDRIETTATTGADGTFKVRGTFRGSWSVHAGHADSSSDYARTVVEGNGPPEGEFRLEMRRGLSIRGRIEDPDGRPFTGDATVLSWTLDANGRPVPATQHWTFTSDGTFLLRGLDPGLHVVHASAHPDPAAPGSVGATGVANNVEAGARDVVVRLPRVAPITGRIVDEDGNPVAAKGRIRIAPSDQGAHLLRRSVAAVVPGDGTFRSPDLDPGTCYGLEASGFEGFGTLTMAHVFGGTADVVLVLVREE